jgi:hypothetical protein
MTNARTRFAAVLTVSLALAGCDNSPTAPPLFTTESFSGNVAQLSSSAHNFITGQASPVVIRISSFAPASITMGLALGTPLATPTGDVCRVTIGQAAVVPGDTFQVQLDPGTYCVMVFDIGNITEQAATVAYSVTVQHR